MTVTINQLIEDLPLCPRLCEGDGIEHVLPEGIVPRGLFMDEGKSGRKKAVVVGINPGNAKDDEKRKTIEAFNHLNRKEFGKFVSDYTKKVVAPTHHYYNPMRRLLSEFEYDGDILWTELVKCQSPHNKEPPEPTFVSCINNWLKKELQTDDFSNSTIFSLGRTSFTYCTKYFPDRFVVGVTHPSGNWSKSKFTELFNEVKMKSEIVRKKLEEYKEKKKGIWLQELVNEIK